MIKNINKSILITSVAGVLLLSAAFIFAHDTSYVSTDSTQGNTTKSEQLSPKVQKLLEEAQARVKQMREDLKEKIGKIQDKKKQDIANKIMNQIDHINKVWTDHFVNVLDKLDNVLQKIKSRNEKAAANGQDVSAVNTAIQKAESDIAAARSAVLSQSQKTYAVNTSTISGSTSTTSGQNNLVSTLRERFKLLKDQLLKDLFAIRDGVMKSARNAVHDAAKALSQVPNVDKEPAASSGNQ